MPYFISSKCKIELAIVDSTNDTLMARVFLT